MGEASQALGVHITTLREWVDAGLIPSFRTPGGHRRFARFDLEEFLERRKSLSQERALTVAERNPLEGVRHELGASQIRQQHWYHHLSDEQRAHERERGQRMLGLLIQYASRRENAEHFIEQGRALAQEYGIEFARTQMTTSEVVRAFLFIRRAILSATHKPQDLTAPNDAEGLRLYQRINDFMDDMMLATVQAYESARQQYENSAGALSAPREARR
jgi:excisionase family DNA binding protein